MKKTITIWLAKESRDGYSVWKCRPHHFSHTNRQFYDRFGLGVTSKDWMGFSYEMENLFGKKFIDLKVGECREFKITQGLEG